jgi:hypothetical protein
MEELMLTDWVKDGGGIDGLELEQLAYSGRVAASCTVVGRVTQTTNWKAAEKADVFDDLVFIAGGTVRLVIASNGDTWMPDSELSHAAIAAAMKKLLAD